MRYDAFIGELESYLDEYEGNTPLPESVRDAVRAELPATRQVRGLLGPVRVQKMSGAMPRSARYGLLAAAIVAAALVGTSLFARDAIGPPPAPTPTATPLPEATPGALPTVGSLAPGEYYIANPYTDQDLARNCYNGCSDYVGITLTVPDGWASVDGLIVKDLGLPSEVAISVWTPGAVYLDPCQWQDSPVGEALEHVPGETHVLAAGTLQAQAGRDASAPREVTLGGQLALRLELTVPADLDLATCDQGEYRSWQEWGVHDGANSHHEPGQADVIYLVDVDRRVLIVDASHGPAASSADLAELQAILDSIFIDRGPF
jgi:hypothetical protein